MKFDRDIIFGIIICGVILIGWDPFARRMGWLPPKNAPAVEKTTAQPDPTKQTTDPVPQAEKPQTAVEQSVASVPKTPARKSSVQPAAPQPVIAASPLAFLENEVICVTVDPNRGAVTGILLKKYRKAVPPDKPSGFFTLARHGGGDGTALVSLLTSGENDASYAALDLKIAEPGSTWELCAPPAVTTTDQKKKVTVERIFKDAAGAEMTVTQTWSIGDNGYQIKYDVNIRNTGKTKLRLPKMQVGGGALGSSQQLSGDAVRGDSHYLDFMLVANDKIEDISADAGSGGGCSCSSGDGDAKFRAVGTPRVRWAALSNKYFCMIIKPGRPDFNLIPGRTGEPKNEKSIVISDALEVSDGSRELPGNGKGVENYSFDCYCGPKILKNLNDFDKDTAKVMHLSWGPLNYLARFMLWFLVKLHALIGSYGVSIIILTLLVRLVFYPLTARGNASMKKMQEVQPKLKELRDKYKDNPQLMNAKMMELYRTEGINPFGGCLPILLQIPVFFALYSTFSSAIELRHTQFLWCHNLAAADTVAYIFSIPINPLVLVMTALMVLQQCMTPMSMEPAQKRMMLIMPVVMLFFFYDLPSGLTLYWTVSNIFSIIQLRMQQRGSKKNGTAQAAKN